MKMIFRPPMNISTGLQVTFTCRAWHVCKDKNIFSREIMGWGEKWYQVLLQHSAKC